MIKKINNFDRLELFNHYNSNDNPFIIITLDFDVTNVVNYCKEHKFFYPTFGYLVSTTANQIDAFKFRFLDNNFYYCDEIISNYTEMMDENNIGYFNVPLKEKFDEYLEDYKRIRNKFLEDKSYNCENVLDTIWMSCSPWYSFESLIPPFSRENTIPQFIWDKYRKVDNKYYMHLMILVHHGFADGSHIKKFSDLLNEKINNLNVIL